MGFILLYVTLMGFFFIIQGFCIFKTGSMKGLFAGPFTTLSPTPKMRLGIKIGCAAIYIGSGLGLITLVVVILLQRHIIGPMSWDHLVSSLPHLLGPLSMVAVSCWALVQPSGVLGWVKHSRPELDVNDPFLRAIMRAVGAGGLVIGLLALVAFA